LVASLLAAGLLGATAPAAQAALLSVDLLASGDGLITRDTATGLDWLDLTQTLALTYDQVVAGGGTHNWYSMGFRFGNTTQLTTLYHDAGIANLGLFNAADHAATLNLLSLVGGISPCGSGESYFWSQHELDPADPLRAGISAFQACSGISYVDPAYDTVAKNALWAANMGSWLYRESQQVPVPGTLELLGLGLVALFLRRRSA
jgi:hypothetical protein